MLWTFLIGLIIGIVAKFLMPVKNQNILVNSEFIGVSGALFANYIGGSTGTYEPSGPTGLISSVFGAVILLAIYHHVLVKRHRQVSP